MEREKTYWLHEFALYPSKGFGPQAQSKFVERKERQRALRLTFRRDGSPYQLSVVHIRALPIFTLPSGTPSALRVRLP